MTEELNETQELELDELTLLKSRADDMGISYHPNIGLDKLKAKINEQLEPKQPENRASISVNTKAKERQEKIKEATKLVRVRVVCMNPTKRQWKGEIITVANKTVGTLRKFVKFDVEYHVPNFIYKVMKDRKFRITDEVSDGKGGKITRNKFVPEFNIEVLPQLTEAELKQLASDQAKRGAIDSE